jgi:hypothetical protein
MRDLHFYFSILASRPENDQVLWQGVLTAFDQFKSVALARRQ